MFSEPYSSDDGSSAQTIHVQGGPERKMSVSSKLRKRVNALYAENARLKDKIQLMQCESQEARHRKQLCDGKQRLDQDHRILNKELNALREESVFIFVSGKGDIGIANRTQAYLDKVKTIFRCQLSRINAMDLTHQDKTLLLEHLKKLFERNVCRMDEWMNLVIEAK